MKLSLDYRHAVELTELTENAGGLTIDRSGKWSGMIDSSRRYERTVR